MASSLITRRRMRASRLTGSPFASADEVVRWHLAMQSQDYAPAKWSVGQRTRGPRDVDLDRALEEGSIVRTHVLRPTWHFVSREDIRWLLALSGPRVHQANAGRYRELGLDGRTRARCERVIARALEGGARLTRDQLAAVLDRAGIDRVGQRMPYILIHCELEAVICSGGLSGKQQTFALLDERVPPSRRPFDRDVALVELVRGYLRSHGPATPKDMSWWSGLTTGDIREALAALGPEVASETIDSLTFWTVQGNSGSSPPGGVHLLQAYDETIVGYTQSRWFGDPRADAVVAAWRDPGRPGGVILADGRVVGHWRRTVGREAIGIEAFLYEPRKRGLRTALGAAAERHGAFFDRPVTLTTAPIIARA
jgi:Winged helix DNA-binding domain